MKNEVQFKFINRLIIINHKKTSFIGIIISISFLSFISIALIIKLACSLCRHCSSSFLIMLRLFNASNVCNSIKLLNSVLTNRDLECLPSNRSRIKAMG